MSEKILTYEDIAISLLNEKYNDTFEIEEVQSHSIFRGYYTVIAYQEENPDLLFRANVNTDGTAVSDNYVSKIVCKDLSNKVARNLDALKGIYYIFTQVLTEPTMLNNVRITLEEYLEANPKNKFTINVNYCPEETNAEEVYSGLCNILNGLDSISGKINLCVIDEEMFSKIQNYMETHDRCYDEYKHMIEEYSAGMIEFKKGTITTSKEEIMKILENKL